MIRISDHYFLLCRGNKCHDLLVTYDYLPETPAKMPSLRNEVGSPPEGPEVEIVSVLLRPHGAWHIAGRKQCRYVERLLAPLEIESIEQSCLEAGAYDWEAYDDPSE